MGPESPAFPWPWDGALPGTVPACFKSQVTCLSCWPSAVLLQAHRYMAKGRMSALQEGVEVVLGHWTFHTMPQWVVPGFTWSSHLSTPPAPGLVV